MSPMSTVPTTASTAAALGSQTTAATPAATMSIATSIIGVKPGCHGAPNHRSCAEQLFPEEEHRR